jgi:hypothetical protein
MGGVVQKVVVIDKQSSGEEFVDQSIYGEKLSADHNLFGRLKRRQRVYKRVTNALGVEG